MNLRPRFLLPLLAIALVAIPAARTALAEVFVERAIPADAAGRTGAVTTRQILVNGIPSTGSSWIVDEEFGRYAQRISRSVRQTRPLAPVVSVARTSMTVVEFLPAGIVRVLSAHAAQTGTSVWEAKLALTDLVRQRHEAQRGIAPGRDHPLVGAPAAARRANVVEVLGSNYNYSAVYLSSAGPCELIAGRVAHLQGLGAAIDAQDRTAGHCSAALTLRGRRIDLTAGRAPNSSTTELVVQTDVLPEISPEHRP